MVEMDADGKRTGRIQGDRNRRLTAALLARLTAGEQLRLLQFSDDIRDGLRCQRRQPRQLGTGQLTVQAYRFDNHPAIVRARMFQIGSRRFHPARFPLLTAASISMIGHTFYNLFT